MKTKHTKGEWKYNQENLAVECNGEGIVMPSNFSSFPRPTHETFKNDELFIEAESNAKLIAAAPELLVALSILIDFPKEEIEHYKQYGVTISLNELQYNQILEAIKKATE